MKKIRALLTDLDGTLIASVDPICNALFQCFQHVDAHVPEKQQIIDMFGLPVEVMLMELGGVKPEETDFNRLQKRFPALFRGVNPKHFGKVMTKVGAKKEHTMYGSVYKLALAKNGQARMTA